MPPEALAEGHEATDVDPRKVLLAVGGFFVALSTAVLLVWGLVAGYRSLQEKAGTAYPDLEPPPPRLEVAPEVTLAEIEGAACARLENYAWADREGRIARIPIEHAMRLMAAHGWPDDFEPAGIVPPRGAARDTTVPRPVEFTSPGLAREIGE